MNIPEIANNLSSYKLLGLGESSHGTHEFFEFKSELFQALVTKHGFNTLMFEDSPQVCRSINKYITGGDSNLNEIIKHLYSVWRVEELKQMIEWLKNNYAKYKVEFIGFDISQTNQNIYDRDKLMAENIKKYIKHNPTAKAFIWAHNSHIRTIADDNIQEPMGVFLKQYYGQKYFAVGLLFGKGSVSATKLKINVDQNLDRTLSTINIHHISPEVSEFTLHKLSSKPFFITKDKLINLNGNFSAIRSIGWGLVPELANEYVEKTNIKNAFDAVAYFPNSTASQTL